MAATDGRSCGDCYLDKGGRREAGLGGRGRWRQRTDDTVDETDLVQAPGRAVGSREVHFCCLDEGGRAGRQSGDTNRNPRTLPRSAAPVQSLPGRALWPACLFATQQRDLGQRLIALAQGFFSLLCLIVVPTCAVCSPPPLGHTPMQPVDRCCCACRQENVLLLSLPLLEQLLVLSACRVASMHCGCRSPTQRGVRRFRPSIITHPSTGRSRMAWHGLACPVPPWLAQLVLVLVLVLLLLLLLLVPVCRLPPTWLPVSLPPCFPTQPSALECATTRRRRQPRRGPAAATHGVPFSQPPWTRLLSNAPCQSSAGRRFLT